MIESFQKNRALADVSTFGIGGPARYFATVATIEEMSRIIAYCRQTHLPYLLLGKGSNCLFDSRGFLGLVIQNKIDFFEDLGEGRFRVGGGASFSLLGARLAKLGWAGLEFACGIPGTVGGAVYMNAGANGGDTSQALESVEWVDEEGRLVVYAKEQLLFRYRFSSFQSFKGAIVAATFALQPSNLARARQLEIIRYRTDTQPYGDKSAGCVFRNLHPSLGDPECVSIGALLDRLGLKGDRVGDAVVSSKHANFIVNAKEASSQDVLALIAKVKASVKQATGYDLHEEIRVIPYDPTAMPQEAHGRI